MTSNIRSANAGCRPASQGVQRVVLADHHEMARHGLAELLKVSSKVTVVDEVDTYEILNACLATTQVDVIVFDLGNTEGERVQLLTALSLAYPRVAVLVFATVRQPYQALQIFSAGAHGLITKRASVTQIITAIHQIAHGRMLLYTEYGENIIGTFAQIVAFLSASYEPLHTRDLGVLQGIVDGATNKEIAAQLSLTSKAVEARVAQICAKPGARSRTDAAVRAISLGIVSPSYQQMQDGQIREVVVK